MGVWSLSSKYGGASEGELSPVALDAAFAEVSSRLADEQSRRASRNLPCSPSAAAVRHASSASALHTGALHEAWGASPPSSPAGTSSHRILHKPSPRQLMRTHRKPLTLDAHAKQSKASGEGLRLAMAGTAAYFVVQGCTRSGRLVVEVGLLAPLLSVGFCGPGACSHKLESLPDGCVRVWYTPSVSGRYVLRVAIRSEPLPGSPFEVLVAPPVPTVTPRSPRHASARREGWRSATSPRQGGSPRSRPLTPTDGAPSPLHPLLRAADVALCVPEGLLAYAKAGQRAHVALRAVDGAYLRPGDATRFTCVLHMQRAWSGELADDNMGHEVAFRGRIAATRDRAPPSTGPRSPMLGEEPTWLERTVRQMGGDLDCSFCVPRAGAASRPA
ncbi:hypothetical protein AB1Y20_022677 [Prymnesium parvum]|uniref:Uncharacterized protein n=1 Tax=Prymnesium parvum TaxID=97485 RepID=A0AB34JJI0_PRYPA